MRMVLCVSHLSSKPLTHALKIAVEILEKILREMRGFDPHMGYAVDIRSDSKNSASNPIGCFVQFGSIAVTNMNPATCETEKVPVSFRLKIIH